MNDTIAAISTPIGEAGIGIVRISGPESLQIAKRIFRGKKGLEPNRLVYGHIVDPEKEEAIDEVLISYHKAPHTYTREDIVEINAHSGIMVLERILQIILSSGARLAEPGEFTKRAYLSGRIDLAQAEAVVSLISARTELARKVALSHLKGELSSEIREIEEEIFSKFTELSADIDFEEVSDIDRDEFIERLGSIKKRVKGLINSFERGRFLSSCAVGVIVGRPNVGKSSILNSLLGEERAIVTPIPGTTRDTISETINISGVPLKIVDTAGLTEAIDIVEKEGIERAERAIQSADIVILVFDGSSKLSEDDLRIIEKIEKCEMIICINKSDLSQKIEIQKIKECLRDRPIVHTCAKENRIDELKNALSLFLSPDLTEAHIVTNVRHREALTLSLSHIERAIKNLSLGVEEEIVSYDLRSATDSLSEITGKRTTEDVLDKIFATFCIGK
jgi:tRNA modification GTPase